jgi:hypothetical protein
MAENESPKTQTVAETDQYIIWKSDEPDGELVYHIEVNNVTLHFFKEEWEEFLELMRTMLKTVDKK